ncbi:MAG: hypothetical protein QM764_00195 [Chitinophagaceae bacterium]
MKNIVKKEPVSAELSLQYLVQSLIPQYQAVAVSQNSFFTNHVPPALAIATDKGVVSSLLSKLLLLAAKHCKDTCIKISAKSYHNIIVMHIKDSSMLDNDLLIPELEPLQTGAEEIGGHIEITSQRKKETTIAFSFVNQPVHQHYEFVNKK